MNNQDPIADMLTRIRNANRVGRRFVMIPRSKICTGIAQVLKDEGYIGELRVTENGAKAELEIVLKWGGGAANGDARRRADEMLDRLGLGPQKHKKPAQLSGGEKQRVAIGRALVKNPSFVFADEPTSALDWENGQKVIELLRDAAHERGASILVVSHDHRLLPFVDVYYHLDDGHLERRPLH